MDAIEYKLESRNPVLISHAISKIFEAVQRDCEQTGESITKVPRFRLLVSRRDSPDPVLSVSICQALVAFAENGLWDVTEALSSFMSGLSTMKNHVALVTALSQLLIIDLKRNADSQKVYRFSLHTPQHPFIVILNQDKEGWRPIVNEMRFILGHRDRQVRENSLEMLRPVFLYVLCNPSSDLSDDCRSQVWQLLLKQTGSSQWLKTEVLLWLCTDSPGSCASSSHRIIELAEDALLREDAERCSALLPVLASYTLHTVRHGLDPRPCLDCMLNIIGRCNDQPGNLSLALMAEVVAICPAIYLYSALQICTSIIDRMPCHDLFLKALVAALLKWMTYPSLLCSNALDVGKDIINASLRKADQPKTVTEMSGPFFETFSHSDPQLGFYTEAIRCMNTWDKENIRSWLMDISAAPMEIRDRWKLMICGLLLQTGEPEVASLACKILVEISREVTPFGSHVLSLVLHKLTRSRDTAEIRQLLQSLPNLLTAKENMPIATHVLDTLLNGDKQLKYAAIELYLRALDKEPRCYRFLSTAVIRTMKNDRSWYADATCARAMRHICENHPHHGQKLVPLLSEILNRCVDVNGGTACALALKSISALCREAVTGICSTWRVLAPKMEKEKRSVVLEALCEFLGDIPTHPSQKDEEYDKLIGSVVTRLWRYVLWNDSNVADAALRALASYQLEQIPLAALPAEFRQQVVLPPAYARTPIDAARKPEEVLPYVPGGCWIEMIQNINRASLTAAGDLLIAFVEQELTGFRSKVYSYKEPRDFKFLPEKSVIRAVGEFLRRCDKSEPKNQRTIVECLRVFAHRYPKPLPSVAWHFLEETFTVSEEAKEYTLRIACHHAAMSPSAKSFVENYLARYKPNPDLEPLLQSNEFLMLYPCLDHLCQAIPPQNLNPFLEATIAHVLEKANLGGEASSSLFERTMTAYAAALKCEDQDQRQSTVLSPILERLLERVDLTSSRFGSYIRAAVELNGIQLERMTSPAHWWEVPPEKLRNAIAIKAELARRERNNCPLRWFDELIEVASTIPSVQPYLLETLRTLEPEMRFAKSITQWVLDMRFKIQTLIVESGEKARNEISFYFTVLFLSLVCLSGVDCMLTRKELLVTSQQVRERLVPLAMRILAGKEDWKSAMSDMMDWCNYMRTSSLANQYRSLFNASLVASRDTACYRNAWTKYLSLRTEIEP